MRAIRGSDCWLRLAGAQDALALSAPRRGFSSGFVRPSIVGAERVALFSILSPGFFMAPKWVVKRNDDKSYVNAQISTSAAANVPVAEPATVEETAYPVKRGQVKVKSQIRATFYPKFENEKSDQEIRQKMIEVVAEGRGALEISLKHSGSLFMYAGDGAAFAKNSYGNLYTAVGVYVLGKTLERAWGQQAKQKQREFNSYLEKRRMCISMELVTAVLGDHGQRPLMDYVVVTAASELTARPRFYSTAELVQFCRQWRLPTNQVWLCSSRKSASACFAAYDALCEEGIYTTVTETLNQVADFTVPGTERHSVVQGEILEGLVARIVTPESVQNLRRVAKEHPVPDHPDGTYAAPGLREICLENRESEQQQIKALLNAVGPDFCSTYDDWLRKIKDDPVQATYLTKFMQTTPADDCTAKLQDMVKLLRSRRMQVRFKCQPLQGSGNEFRMTIHVLQDSVFRRYQKEMQHNRALWPLYRGFFVDIKLSKDENDLDIVNALETTTLGDASQDALADDAQNLMVKLKFLPYKIRTFLIRNGLHILFTRGQSAYREYYLRQMKTWGTTPQKQRELSQLLDEWAGHITSKYKSGRMKDGTYLSEAEPFLKQFAARSAKNQRLVGQAGTNISTEQYLAAMREEEDEEGDLKEEEPAASPQMKEKGLKSKGILVFFPGIPGCAKSAVCREILSAKDGLSDGRPMKSLMGDMIKGRYWPKLSDERKKNPSVITFADKNAPTEDVWKLVSDICSQTDAVGVPVVPDSEGTDSNPFSLDTLAIFIFRVLHRENHPGNLDKNSPYAGYVLLMFYNLYEGKDRNEFETGLLERFGSLVKLPVLKADRAPLPAPVKAVLEEGLELYHKHSSKHGKVDPSKGSFKKQWDEWEPKLRKVLLAHSDYFKEVQVPFEEVVKSVREQLRSVASGDIQVRVPDTGERKFHAYTYAAVSLSSQDVVDAVKKLASTNPQVQAFVSPKNLDKTMRPCHITLAHMRSHGIPAVAEYSSSVDSEVAVKFTALVFSQQLCALEATVMSDSVASKNAWPHATLWTAPGVPPKEAGSLGTLAQQGKATRVPFPEPVVVKGKVQFMR